MEKRTVMAVDIGGSKYAVGLVRENGTILCKRRYDWKHISAESVIEEICESMHAAMLEQYQDLSPIYSKIQEYNTQYPSEAE